MAEDNAVNQRVIPRTLEKIGFADVTLVEDGVEAVDAFRSREYDIVLMDCQMPHMDGLDATREIRRIEQTRQGSAVPIVALTVNALEAERQQCLAAGMNDFVSMPFKPAHI